jgi:hypothetical protein
MSRGKPNGEEMGEGEREGARQTVRKKRRRWRESERWGGVSETERGKSRRQKS